MRTLYFDCFCGAAGDMIVGALLDAGADFEKIRDALDSLGVDGFSVRAFKDRHELSVVGGGLRSCTTRCVLMARC